MEREEILKSLKDILSKIRPNLDLSSVTEDAQLVRDLGLDSLTILLLSLAIENQFGFQFEGNPQFTTVKESIDYIIASKRN